MSWERKKVESAVMTLDRSRIIRNVRSASPSSLAASRSPIPLSAPEVQQHPEDDAEDEGPEEEPDEAQKAPLEPAALVGLVPVELGSNLRAQKPENTRARVGDAVQTARRAGVIGVTPEDRRRPRPCPRFP